MQVLGYVQICFYILNVYIDTEKPTAGKKLEGHKLLRARKIKNRELDQGKRTLTKNEGLKGKAITKH